jgi:hypothetical protein
MKNNVWLIMVLVGLLFSSKLMAFSVKGKNDTTIILDLINGAPKILSDTKGIAPIDKNDIADQLALIKYDSKKEELVIKLENDNEVGNGSVQEDDFSPSFELKIYVTDINKDKVEEIYIMLICEMLTGKNSPPIVYVFNKINSRYKLVYETAAYEIRVNQNSKSQFPELCFADDFKWINSKAPIPGSMAAWSSTQYVSAKKPYPTVLKWVNVDAAHKQYQATL